MSGDWGGAAFPCLPPQDTAAGVAVGYPHPEAGMSLRDYFAAHAPNPPWWLSDNRYVGDWDGAAEMAADIARWQLIYADAMLKARNA